MSRLRLGTRSVPEANQTQSSTWETETRVIVPWERQTWASLQPDCWGVHEAMWGCRGCEGRGSNQGTVIAGLSEVGPLPKVHLL